MTSDLCAPSVPALLDVWERSAGRAPAEQALALLGVCDAPDGSSLTGGQRDARLLELRRALFGSTLTAVAMCPACGERAEIVLGVDDLQATSARDADTGSTEHIVSAENVVIRFRLPTAADLAQVARTSDLAQAEAMLLRRCVIDAQMDGQTLAPDALPPAALAALDDALATADPQADVRLAPQCPACSTRWEVGFDVAAFLSAELDAWARRLLYDVHTLAAAYGWSEREILSLSPTRRRLYMDLIGVAE